ncbi:gamma-glutamylcyclotransferase family protein [Litchfieldella xinjiangensis]|uniref:gamma-glutamylcyclotransferase family protein n=1 Tax=Litchfieldella xinjiangensis TaxID=1166948 RepID=UPI000694A73F|nr:gamma-glutamylcyclotransferase family protein [Halomonas xinjiangensis]
MHSPTLAIQRTPLVAVYGTLKRGLSNHHVLDGAEFVGPDVITSATLYDLGPYPGAKPERSRGIEVEVFKVNARLMTALDLLEDYRVRAPAQGMYDRAIHRTAFGPAWLYLYNPDVRGRRAIRAGGWPNSA